MIINTNNIMSMTEANQNFSRVAKLADKTGSAIIFKNNKPKYMVLDLSQETLIDLTEDEKIDIVAKRVLNKFRPAFEELAK